MLKHAWDIVSYQLSQDRQNVFIVDVCKECRQRRKYERPNKRQSTAQ